MKFRNPDNLGAALLLLITEHLKMAKSKKQKERKKEKTS